jgi:hypothetical protein
LPSIETVLFWIHFANCPVFGLVLSVACESSPVVIVAAFCGGIGVYRLDAEIEAVDFEELPFLNPAMKSSSVSISDSPSPSIPLEQSLIYINISTPFSAMLAALLQVQLPAGCHPPHDKTFNRFVSILSYYVAFTNDNFMPPVSFTS